MALHTWEEGENIYAEYLNGNVDYLLDTTTSKLSALETELTADITALETQVAANKSAIGSLEDTISDLSGDINSAVSGILANIAPKYSSATTISSGWTATKYGWINWLSQANDSTTTYLWINGTEVGYHSHYKYGDYYRTQFMVSKGDVVTFSSNSSAKFFPCKGA